MKILLISILILVDVLACAAVQDWTWLYIFRDHKIQENGQLNYKKLDIPHFTQLIFSWNSKRPTSGYFSFWARVRDAKNNKWYTWHHMMDWGNTVQKSYAQKYGAHQTGYHHVRLELPAGHTADGFEIKIEKFDGADFNAISSVGVSTAHLGKFDPECSMRYGSTPFRSVYVSGVPRQSQRTVDHPESDRLCSPTSSSMMVGYLCGFPVNPVIFADNVYDDGLDAFGSWPFNTAHAYEHCPTKFDFFVTRLKSFEQLYNFLKKNIPVVVSVRGKLRGAPQRYDRGHLIIVVGWDRRKKRVICHDPACSSNTATLKVYSIDAFRHAWENSRRLAYIAVPKDSNSCE